MRKFRDVLAQDGGTVDPGDKRGETATVDPGRVTDGNLLGRTDANDECPSHRKEECDVLAAQSTREVHRNACQNVERSSAVWLRPRRCNALMTQRSSLAETLLS